MDSQEPMFDSDGGPVDHMDTGDASAVTTVEAPLIFHPVFHRTRTLEVLEQTYVTVRSVKISQGASLDDDHAARVEALQRSTTCTLRGVRASSRGPLPKPDVYR